MRLWPSAPAWLADSAGSLSSTTYASYTSRRADRHGGVGNVALVTVEVLYSSGCPNHERWLPHLHALLQSAGVREPLQLVAVETHAAARNHRFLGSPSLRIDGTDVESGAWQRTDFGLKCRLYATTDGLVGVAPNEWVLAAVYAAKR